MPRDKTDYTDGQNVQRQSCKLYHHNLGGVIKKVVSTRETDNIVLWLIIT